MSECFLRIVLGTVIVMTVVLLITKLINASECSYRYENFAGEKISSKPKIVLYYTPWCGHSTNFINGAWKSFTDYVNVKLADKLDVQSISCTDNKSICNQEKITGYPTVILYSNNEKYEFVGNRTLSDLVEFAESVLSLNERVIKNEKPKLVLFYAPWCGHCKNFMNNGWKEFIDFYKKNLTPVLDVVTLSCDDNKQLCQEIGVRGYPTVILFVNGKRIIYSGDRTKEDLLYFISGNI